MTRDRGLDLRFATSVIPALGAKNRNFTFTFPLSVAALTDRLGILKKSLHRAIFLDIVMGEARRSNEYALHSKVLQNVQEYPS